MRFFQIWENFCLNNIKNRFKMGLIYGKAIKLFKKPFIITMSNNEKKSRRIIYDLKKLLFCDMILNTISTYLKFRQDIT